MEKRKVGDVRSTGRTAKPAQSEVRVGTTHASFARPWLHQGVVQCYGRALTRANERTRIHPSMHRGGYTPGTELCWSRGFAINPVTTPSAHPKQPSGSALPLPSRGPGSLSSAYKLPGPLLRLQIPIIHSLWNTSEQRVIPDSSTIHNFPPFMERFLQWSDLAFFIDYNMLRLYFNFHLY